LAKSAASAKVTAAGGRVVRDREDAARRVHRPRVLKAGVLDLIDIQLRPFLLGQGRRLFDNLPPEHIDLDLVRTLDAPGILHPRYEVRHH
jgi:hypothetical protein